MRMVISGGGHLENSALYYYEYKKLSFEHVPSRDAIYLNFEFFFLLYYRGNFDVFCWTFCVYFKSFNEILLFF